MSQHTLQQNQENDSSNQNTSVTQQKANPQKEYSTKQGKKKPIQAKNGNGKPITPIQAKNGNGKPITPIQAKNGNGKPITPIQAKRGSTLQRKGSNGGSQGLPAQMQANMESMGGVDLSDVKVHRNSSKPAEIDAKANAGTVQAKQAPIQQKTEAFAQGSDIHLAPGMDKHLGHEAWHVVQQKQGRVQPTTTQGGVAINDSPQLEKEADDMGAKATQMKATNEPMQMKKGETGQRKTTQAKQTIQRQTNDGLTETQRMVLLTRLTSRTGTAYSTFIDVANEILGEIKAKKAADAALVASLINIAMVWIPGGVGTALASLANFLGKSKSDKVFTFAYHLLDKSDKIASSLLTIPKDQVVRHVTTTGSGVAASKEKFFLNGMKQGFRLTVDHLIGQVGLFIGDKNTLSDEMLLALTAKWDPKVLTRGVLKSKLSEQVKMWQDTVVPIGEVREIRASTLEQNKLRGYSVKGLAWVGEESPSALCLVEATSTGRAPTYRFLDFVSKDMKDMAISKALQQPNQKSGIRTVPKSWVKGFPKEKMPTNTAVK